MNDPTGEPTFATVGVTTTLDLSEIVGELPWAHLGDDSVPASYTMYA